MRATCIDAVETVVLSFPLAKPFRAAVRTIASVDLAVATVRVRGGLTGHSYGFGFGAEEATLLARAVDVDGARAIGRDAVDVEARWRELWDSLVFLGQTGLAVAALGVLDIALWDLRAQTVGLPLWRLLGGARERVPVYGSGGSLDASTNELLAEMAGYAAEGCRAVKLKLGLGLAADRARVAAVRDALGPEVRIIVDGNQQWDAKGALAMARALADLDIWWLEEPAPVADLDAYAAVAAASPIRIATGETTFAPRPFADLIARRGADILMPNLQRVGGITAWRKVAAAAELQGLTIASHVHPEFSVHTLAGIPNALVLEYLPWWPQPFRERLSIRDGFAAPSTAPGLGLTLDPDVISRHRVA
jgi:L-alanine-DL-glutamate epimerase-like enolase superfamily enzyme